MINRIGDNNYTNPYVRNTQKTVGSGEKAPAFLLNYDEDGVVWDRESSDEKKDSLDSKVSDGKNGNNQRKNDRAVEYISSVQVEDRKEKVEANKAGNVSFLESLTKFFTGVRNIIARTLEFIWYGDDRPTAGDDVEAEQKSEDVNEILADGGEEEAIESESEAEQKKNLELYETAEIDSQKLEEVLRQRARGEREESTLVNNVRKLRRRTEFDMKLAEARKGMEGTPARNTDLLTTYDKRGKIKEISPTDSGKILKGDKALKL